MEHEILEPFTAGALEMLAMMFGIEGRPDEGDPGPAFLSAYVDLRGQRTGRLVLSFPRESATALVAEMLAMDAAELDEAMLADGVGEIANMIAGYAKTRLAETEFHFNLNLPSVVFGEEERAALCPGGEARSRQVATDLGGFEVSVWFAPASA